jgi:hypothetical protein
MNVKPSNTTCVWGVVSSSSFVLLVTRNLRQSVLNFKKPSSFLGKSVFEMKRINLKEPLEYFLIENFKFLIPQSSL